MTIDLIASYSVSRAQLLIGSLLSLLLYPIVIVVFYELSSAAWAAISGLPVEPPIIGFMSDYSEPAKNGYWVFVLSSILAGLLLSALLPSIMGASIGKWVLGICYVTEDGNRVTILQTLKKTVCSIVLFLMVALPGPILGFSAGDGSEPFSLAALFIGIIASSYLAFARDASNRSWSYRFSAIVPIKKSHIVEYREAVSERSK